MILCWGPSSVREQAVFSANSSLGLLIVLNTYVLAYLLMFLDVELVISGVLSLFRCCDAVVLRAWCVVCSLTQTLWLAVFCHCSGAVTLSFYVLDVWCSKLYWYVFGLCCIPPAVTELFVWICNCVVKKNFWRSCASSDLSVNDDFLQVVSTLFIPALRCWVVLF